MEPTAGPCARLSMPRRIGNGRPGGFTALGRERPGWPAAGRSSAAHPRRTQLPVVPTLVLSSPLEEGRHHPCY